MFEALELPFVQRAVLEVLLLSVAAGLIGTWIVLRGLAFHSHAAGAAAFPGLVLADGLGLAAAPLAFAAAALFALAVAAVTAGRGGDVGPVVGLLLVGMLALGVILASDVFASAAGLEALLFGSILLLDDADIALAAGIAVLALVAASVAGRHWVAHGFEPGAHAPDRRRFDLALLVLVALGTVAALSAVGALLVAALFVVPAATTRLWISRMRAWQLATAALCAFTGVAGILLAVELNAPPGATIAVLAGAGFALGAALRSGRLHGWRRLRPLRWGTAGAAALALAGCGAGSGGEAAVATTPLVGDIVGEVAGDDVEVRTLLAPNADPHDYEPRPQDVEALASAEVVFASGGEIDAWIGDALADSGSQAELVELADAIPHPLPAAAGEAADPHWWHDPRNVAGVLPVIAAGLGRAAPGAANALRARAATYAKRVERLDAALERCLGAIPPARRKLVTDHDSLGYLARRYRLRLVGAVIPARTSEAQPSAGELAELRQAISREDVAAVFPEAGANRALAEAVARESGVQLGGELYGDSLGPAGSPAGSYLGMQAANAAALVRGLAGRGSCDRLPR